MSPTSSSLHRRALPQEIKDHSDRAVRSGTSSAMCSILLRRECGIRPGTVHAVACYGLGLPRIGPPTRVGTAAQGRLVTYEI